MTRLLNCLTAAMLLCSPVLAQTEIPLAPLDSEFVSIGIPGFDIGDSSKLYVRKAETGTAATEYFAQVNEMRLNFAASTPGDYRGFKSSVLIDPLQTSSIYKMAGGSFYILDAGSGARSLVFGGTSQFFNNGNATVSSSTGILASSLNNNSDPSASGKMVSSNAVSALSANWRNTPGVAIEESNGIYARTENYGSSSIGLARAAYLDVSNFGSGSIPYTTVAIVNARNAGTGTMNSVDGLRVTMTNSGTMGTYRGIVIQEPAGTAPTNGGYALYSGWNAPSYFAGNVQVGGTLTVNGRQVAMLDDVIKAPAVVQAGFISGVSDRALLGILIVLMIAQAFITLVAVRMRAA